jgi:predicted GNAT family acetyltransferase
MMSPFEVAGALDRYFSAHMGYNVSDVPSGGVVVSAHLAERREPSGALPPDVRLLLFDDRIIATVRADLKPAVEQILAQLPVPAALLMIGFQSRIAGLVDTLPRENRLQVLYAVSAPPTPRDTHACRRLLADDRWSVHTWFREVAAESELTGVLASAERSIREGIAFGAFADGRLVALARTLTPNYLDGEVEDIAIRTAEGYRRRGYAAALVALQTQAIQELGRVPMYRCNWTNEASLSMALKLGYRRYANVISFRRSTVAAPAEAPEE